MSYLLEAEEARFLKAIKLSEVGSVFVASFFEDAGPAAGYGASVAGPLALVIYSLANFRQGLSWQFLGRSTLIATYFALLGGAFGILYIGFGEVS